MPAGAVIVLIPCSVTQAVGCIIISNKRTMKPVLVGCSSLMGVLVVIAPSWQNHVMPLGSVLFRGLFRQYEYLCENPKGRAPRACTWVNVKGKDISLVFLIIFTQL